MKKDLYGIVVFAGFLGIVFLLHGCAMQEDLLIVNDKINAMSQRTGQVHKEIGLLQDQLENVKKELRSIDTVKQVEVIGKKQADMGVQLENIRADLGRLQGSIEEHDNQLQQLSSQSSELGKMGQQLIQVQDLATRGESEGKSLGEKNQKILEQVNLLQERIGDLEKRLSRREELAGSEVKGEKASPGRAEGVPEEKKTTAKKSAKEDYEEAYDLFKKDSYSRAREKFKVFLKDHPNSELAGNAQYWLAETYYQQERYEEAILEYEKVLNDRKGAKVPSALLKQGLAFHNLNDTKTAKYLLEKLIKEHPKSEQAELARTQLKKWSK